MPKQTFFNLPEKKRQTLLNAAEKEFSRVPLYEASIANIIKESGIPRGSFYQYFDDKEDLYYYLLNRYTVKMKELLLQSLQKQDGDLLGAFGDFFAKVIYQQTNERNVQFLKNAFLHVAQKMELSFSRIFLDKSHPRFEDILDYVDSSRLNIRDEEDLHHIIQIITAVIFRNFVEKYANNLTNEEAAARFHKDLQLLKDGLYKEK